MAEKIKFKKVTGIGVWEDVHVIFPCAKCGKDVIVNGGFANEKAFMEFLSETGVTEEEFVKKMSKKQCCK